MSLCVWLRQLLVMVGCAWALVAGAAGLEVQGVKLDDKVELAGTSLGLNGAGVRYKVVFKVYVGALYAAHPVHSLEELVKDPGAKRMRVTMLRDIDAAEMGKLLTRGIEDNMGKTAMSKLVPGLVRMGEMFASQKKLMAGDTFLVDWLPGTGTLITVRDHVQGEPFKEPEFFAALMSIWLGPSPADAKLKEALLGEPR
jgi:hypothetical protein